MRTERFLAALVAALFLYTPFTQAADITGTVEWLRRVELSTPVSGMVEAVHVEPGERVRKGQPLVSLDRRVARAERERAQALVARLERLRAEAQRELERAQELYDRTVLSEHELELARISEANAEAEYQSARAALVRAEVELDYSVIKAPFEGLVVARPVQAGQTVITRLQPMPLVVLADSTRMSANISVPQDVAGRLAPGQRLRVTVAGRVFDGSVAYLGLEPEHQEAGQRYYRVDVAFSPDPASPPRAGQTAVVTVP